MFLVSTASREDVLACLDDASWVVAVTAMVGEVWETVWPVEIVFADGGVARDGACDA